MSNRNRLPRNRREQRAREKSLATLARMRRDDISLSAAAKIESTTPRAVRRYVGSALIRKGNQGRYEVRSYDRIPRDMNFLVPGRTVGITVKSSRTASRIGEHLNAVRRFLATGDESVLKPFRGKKFRSGKQTYEFVTDIKALQNFGNAGFRGESLYRTLHGGTI